MMSFGVADVADAAVKPQSPRSGNPIAAMFATPADHALITADAVPVIVSVVAGQQDPRVRRQP